MEKQAPSVTAFPSSPRYTLTIDDDPIVSKLIEGAVGMPTVAFSSTREMLKNADTLNPIAVFVDVHLDQENGLAALPEIRNRWRYCPIIVITGDSADRRIAEALTRGADDFIMKPLRPREIMARLQARLADQALKQASHSLAYGDLKLDQTHRILRGPKGERFLSPTELNLLAALMRSAGTTLERATLKNQCWDHIAVSDNALDRKVFEVRRAILDVGSQCSIGTSYGVGFFLELPPSAISSVGAAH